MNKIKLIVLVSGITICESLSGQCPDRDSLWNNIQQIQYSSTLSDRDELNQLLVYDQLYNSCIGKYDSVYTYLQARIGVNYYLLTDYMQAVQYLKKAIRVIKENAQNPLITQRYIVKFYYYLSICYDSLKLVTQQNEAIDSCISYEMKNDTMYHYSCFLLFNNVKNLYLKGDYNFCVEHATLGESLTRKSYHYIDRKEYILFFITNKVNSLISLKKFTEAEQFLLEKRDEFLKSGKSGNIAEIYRLFGYINRTKGENQTAVDYFLKAYKYDKTTKEKTITAETLTQIGLIHAEKFKKPELANYFYRKALQDGNITDEFYIYGYMSNAYVHMQKFDSAFIFFQKAFNSIKKGLNEEDLLINTEDYITANSTEHVLNIVLDKGDAYLQKFIYDGNKENLKRAIRIFIIADRLLYTIKENQFAQESRLYWLDYARRLYEHAIQSSYLNGNTTGAFYFFERSRAVLLNDQLNEQNTLSGDDILNLAHLKSKILITGRELRKKLPSEKEYDDLQNVLFTYKQELLRFQDHIKKQNPIFYQNKFDTSLINIGDIQKKLLNKNGTFLSLFSGDSSVYTLVITATNTRFLKTKKQSFDNLRDKFIAFLDNPYLLNSQFSSFSDVSHSLFNTIFQDIPVAPGKVIICADGRYFPFEALVTGKPGDAIKYFVEDHAVSYTYSARFLLNDFYSGITNSAKNFMGMAPVNYPSSFSLASLSGSDKSLKTISGHFGDAVSLVSSAATRNSFIEQFYKYKIIQLYTHASDSSTNNEPVIYFADSPLYLSDLIGENKPFTRLIVLSACETGLGKDYKGEGVFSFNRGFAALGIPSSVTNLWTIDNESTYKLTELFYKYVADGLPLDEALQKAKTDFIKTSSKEKQLPYYWAAAVLVGNTDSIQVPRSISWAYYVAAVGIPVLFFALFLVLRKQKRFNLIPGKAGIAS